MLIVYAECQNCPVISLWSTCCNSCPASCGKNTRRIICGFQNVISCRFGGSHSSNRTALPRLVCLHQELALSSFSSAAELVSCLCAALGPSPTLGASVPGTQLLVCSPSLLQLPRHQGPRAGRKLQASGAACAILFQTHVAVCRVATYSWSQTESKSFSVLRTLSLWLLVWKRVEKMSKALNEVTDDVMQKSNLPGSGECHAGLGTVIPPITQPAGSPLCRVKES